MEKSLQFLTKKRYQIFSPAAFGLMAIFTFFFFIQTTEAQLSVSLQAQSPLCGGFSTGSITATPSGSTPPYTYLWSTGATGNPIQSLPVGTYTVTVTSSTGVTGTATATLTAPPPLQNVITVTNCSNPGSMTANVSGGVPPYMYMWNNGGNTPTISNLSPGEYCVTIMDSNNCGYVSCQTLGPPLSIQVDATPVICGNLVGGTATAVPTGGDPPFTYLWSTGGTTATIMNLGPGTYTVTVTGDNGCSATGSGTVVLTAGNFSVDLDVTQPVCAGTSYGSINATVNGGAPPLDFAWSSGQNTQNINNLSPGTYTVTVTDAFGCSATQTATLNYQSNLSVVLNTTNPNCANSNNGSVSAVVSNGATPYSYLWSNGATTQTITNLPAGAYSVTVTDQLNCTKTATATVTAPPALTLNVTATNASHCGAADGSVLATPVSGGNPPFTYLWSNGVTTPGQSNLTVGAYTVTVTSAQGCTASGTATVTEPQTLNVSLTGSSTICGSNNDGTLTANVVYGTAPYTFAWSNGGNTQTLTNLPPGTYTVTVTSVQGCTGSATKVITGIPEINLSGSITNIQCFGSNTGSISASATGGAPPLSFLWNTGANTQNLNNLAPGTYTLTVTDNAGCSKTQAFTITAPAPLNLGFNTSGGSCGSNGSATVMVTGGISPYTYLWNNGETTATINNLAPGTYTVTITDANNCTATGSTNIQAYPQTNITVSANNTSCNGTANGSATASVTGGTAPFQYLWSNNATTATISNLSPGTYSVTVTDANGCTQSGSATVMAGPGLNVNIVAPTYICTGETGTATANVSGGNAPYTYVWSDGQTTQTAVNLQPGTYSVTATDADGCFGSSTVTLLPGGNFTVNANVVHVSCFGLANGSISLSVNGGISPYSYLWSTGATTASVNNLSPGTYSVTVTDGSNCEVVQSHTVTQPALLTVSLNANNGNCITLGTISATVGGGTAPFTYNWSSGQTTPTISGLAPGNYQLTVTDANGCTAVKSATIAPIPQPACQIQLVQPISSIGGSDGQLIVTVQGGMGPFTYNWSNGQTTQTISNLNAGLYEVTVTDANACETVCSFTLYDPAKVGDFVWLDADEDGIQDPGEVGINGVTVKITGTSVYGNTVNLTTTTGPNGMYMFLVNPGNYKITFTQPAGLLPSPANQGSNDAIDSDANVLNGMTPVFTLTGGETNLTIDAGFYPAPPCENVTVPGTICCDQTLCGPGVDPAPITQVTAPSGGTGNLEFLWMFTNVPGPFSQGGWTAINTATGPNYDPGPLYETTYFIRCVRRENCVEFLESNIVTITVDTVAVAEINGPQGGCVNTPIDFSATNNGPNATYAWNFGDGVPATANTQSVPGVVWSSFGLKTVTLSVTRNGCTSTDILQIYITNLPSFCGNAIIINAGVTGSNVLVDWFYEKQNGSQHNFQLEWAWENSDFKPVNSTIEAEQEADYLHYTALHEYARPGRNFYRVTLTNSDGAITESNTVQVDVAGTVNDFVRVYPNPFSDFLSIELTDRFEGQAVSFEIVSVEGRKVGVFEVPSENTRVDIPSGHLPAGVYFLLVKYGDKVLRTFKIVK